MRFTHTYYNRKRFAKCLTALLCLMLAALFAFTSCGETPAGGNESTAGTGGEAGSAGGTNDPDVTDDPAGTTSGDVIPEDSGTNGGSDTGNGSEDSGTAGETGGAETTGTPAQTTGGSATTENPGTSTDPTPTELEYKVTVVDGDGKPLKGLIVLFYKSTEKVAQDATDANGVASKKLPADNYTFEIVSTKSNVNYFYDQNKCVFTPTSASCTVSLTELAGSKGETIYAKPAEDADHKAYFASYVGEGQTVVRMAADEMTYVIFAPTRGGYYRFSANSGVDIGYYGGTFNVQSSKAVEMIGDYFEINVRSSSISGDGGVKLVLGVKAKSAGADTATITIERLGDPKKDAADEPYQEVKASGKYLVKYTGSTSGKLKDFDITDAASKIVYNAKDGYYHFGTETGPVVMLRIKSKSPYLDSFTDICDKSVISHYYYKENGDFDYKVQYNGFIASYAAVADASGVVPLNDELIDMLKTVTPRWCDEDSPEYRLDVDVNGNPIVEVKEISWLFACCYYE